MDFAHDVVPVLKKHCIECHGGEKAEGGFSLNTRGLLLEAEAVVPGKAAESEVIRRVTSSDPDEQMPPKDKPRLSDKEVAVLRAWIDAGLPWQDGFSFSGGRYEPPLRPRRPELPPAVDGRTNPVDRILDAYLAAHEVPRPQPLGDAAFMRRLYLDLIGLPPTPDELSAFTADTRGDKRERLVHALLGRDQAYAEHWMTFWNDLLRNAYSGTGYIDGGRRQITGWLYRLLLENKPYDQFVRELIAPPTPESEGFIRGIKWRGNVNASQSREVQFAQSISQSLLGINMKCASCHDSFIDRWKLGEAYGLAAVYASGPLEVFRCDKPTGEIAQPAWIFPELGTIDAKAPQPERLEQLAALVTHPENGRLTRTVVNRLWHQLLGRGIVHPVDAMHTEPFSSDLLDYLAVYLADHEYDLKQVLALIATSRAYQSQAVILSDSPDAEYVYSGPIVKRMTAEQFLDSIWAITGTWPKPDGGAFKLDGRRQGGQLAAVLAAHGPGAEWKDRPVRAVFTPLDALQASLGRPNREQIVTTRPDLLTTLEAIHLANGEELAETLRRAAAELLRREFGSSEAMIDWLYRYALSRSPTREERAIAGELLGEKPAQRGVEDLLWTVFLLPEFQYIR